MSTVERPPKPPELRVRLKRQAGALLGRVLLPRARGGLDLQGIQRVLVYGGMGIGNMVMFTPALAALRRTAPHLHMTLLVGASGADQVVEGSGLFDRIIKAAPGRLARLWLAVRLRRERYDLIIASFQGDDFKLVTLLSGCRHRIGHSSSPDWTNPAEFLYNIPVVMAKGEHEVDRKLRLVRAAGVSDEEAAIFHIDETDRRFAREFLRDEGVGPEDTLVGIPIDVSRGQEWKQWDLARLAELCRLLEHRVGVRTLLMGARDEQGFIEKAAEEGGFTPIVAVGRTTLKQAGALLERCAVTICSDTGLMHVSAAVGTPVVAIYGPTDHTRTSPLRYGRGRVVRQGVECSPCFKLEGADEVLSCPHRKCLGQIDVPSVWREVEAILRRESVPAR